METSAYDRSEHPLGTGPGTSRPGYGRGGLSSMDARQVVAIALIALGMVGVVVAWFGISGTLDPGEQMPYLASGGIGGAALIAIGVMVYVSWEHLQDRAALAILLQRLDEVEAALRESTVANGSGPGDDAPPQSLRPRTQARRAPRSSQS